MTQLLWSAVQLVFFEAWDVLVPHLSHSLESKKCFPKKKDSKSQTRHGELRYPGSSNCLRVSESLSFLAVTSAISRYSNFCLLSSSCASSGDCFYAQPWLGVTYWWNFRREFARTFPRKSGTEPNIRSMFQVSDKVPWPNDWNEKTARETRLTLNCQIPFFQDSFLLSQFHGPGHMAGASHRRVIHRKNRLPHQSCDRLLSATGML